ncbi:MAG: HAD family hydrolase [Bacillota bacterium]
MSIKAVIFDMDDTLFCEEHYVMSGFRAVGKWLEHPLFYDTAKNLFQSGERKMIFNRSLQQLRIPYDEFLIKEMLHVYRNHDPHISLHEDAVYVLDQLHNKVKLALITDGYLETQQKKFYALKLQDYFQTVVFTDELGREHWKPSPLPYQIVSTTLNVLPQECVYIGDNPAKDFVTAKKLGWLTIYIQRNDGIYHHGEYPSTHAAHHIIHDLKELTKLAELKPLFHYQTI